MCYNVLCDKYATRQLYGYCPSWALNWEYRKKAIMQEILSCNADIISLQVKDIPLFLFLVYSHVLVFYTLSVFTVNCLFSKPSEYKRKKKWCLEHYLLLDIKRMLFSPHSWNVNQQLLIKGMYMGVSLCLPVYVGL